MPVSESKVECQELLLHPNEVCRRLSLPRTRVYELLRAGTLPSVRIGRTRLVATRDLVAFVEHLRADWTSLAT